LKGRDVREVSSIAFLRQVERARNILSSDYCRTIKIWSNAFGWGALHIDFFDRLRDDPQAYINGVLRHIGATTPWALPAKFMKTKVHATNSIVAHNREIPEVVEWYIADRLLEPVERLLSVPERLAYEAYHVVLDLRLWLRWRHLERSYVSDGGRPRMN